ncbi:MAG: hypothetical protein COT89_01910 [Candidatus Colwellbacteria bacterium CG10_big_fil_rev_8_21_14_0_10_42_22]|uniref:Uncharacterized protein n=1 Tax=Candidatus Colwellbacteria bacterium CG10_big_fil_rev_8_21_14_0_10_42_22 TaxID=1974540 RepID=A0A2H0VFV3_9BACT|nr:MAG: hypothetical protein COT89_01910 [Candidatus Colwellbacteria bacterium CG10_big_fil_rev_8_21_14_0_10_42_22]
MAFVHQHKRKRVYRDLEPYPHVKIYYRVLDNVVSVVSVVAPLSVIPQMWNIWANRQAVDVSLLTWSLFLLFTLPLLLYSIAHRDKRLITMYSLNTLFNIVIVLGIILFN